MIAFIISNEEMKDIMEIVKYLEESVLLNKGVSKTIEHEEKELKGKFIGMLEATLSASSIANEIADEAKKYGWGIIRAVERNLNLIL